MDTSAPQLKKIWNQKEIPVVLRRGGKGERLRIRLPYSPDNESWLRNGKKRSPEWVKGDRYWEVPKSWFNDFVAQAMENYGKLYIIQPYREQEKCAPACQNAVGHECQCSCMGANHGVGNDGSWFEVSETFAARWRDRQLACRLMTSRATVQSA